MNQAAAKMVAARSVANSPPIKSDRHYHDAGHCQRHGTGQIERRPAAAGHETVRQTGSETTPNGESVSSIDSSTIGNNRNAAIGVAAPLGWPNAPATSPTRPPAARSRTRRRKCTAGRGSSR